MKPSFTPKSREPFAFATTQWTQVLAARGQSPEAKHALRELCEAYYAPVEAFIRHARRGTDDARDLTHEFLIGILAGHALDNLQRGRGRFRSYLLGAVKHFLSDARDRDLAAKRGGGQSPVSLDTLASEADAENDSAAGLQIADPGGFPPDAFFDRHWALNLLDRVLSTMAREHEQAGKTQEYEALKPWLTGDAATLSPSDAAARLGTSDGAAKVAIHRLRRRFRQLVKAEIAATVADADEVPAELDYLIQALSHAGSMP
ncbi:MAG: sigma-70 family RNA polymerase sigma factor [Planctomycetes bacterium]|nr:sigma-70 family RNA polymerase sigma factor [Planctomycetota bacterium]MBL7042005.1 sigma-70 family RNA polymerase sigma factor [Pirellulaceae bacterium]